MKIGILGSGDVAKSLGAGLHRKGHAVLLGSSSPAKLADWAAARPGVRTGSFADAAAFGEIVVLAVKGSAAIAAVQAAGPQQLAGKVVIDTTNPIADASPENGVLRYFTGPNDSLLETLQREFPALRFVKAYNSVGHALMVDPAVEGGPPTMYIAGHDAAARDTVATLVRETGWAVADLGGAEAARAIEPLCMLWCIPGFLRGEWAHAFKLVQAR